MDSDTATRVQGHGNSTIIEESYIRDLGKKEAIIYMKAEKNINNLF